MIGTPTTTPAPQAEAALPPRLQPGAAIAVVSTSWGGLGLLPERAGRAIAALERLGHPVKVMPHARGTGDGLRDWVSGTAAQRADDLHAAFTDPEVGLVLSAIGGEHSAHLLPRVDFDLIAAHPKPFSGYSDTTTLLHAIHARTGMVTFSGPALLPEFGEVGGPDEEVVTQFLRLVTDPTPAGPLPMTDWQATEDRRVSDAERRPRTREPGAPRTVLRGGTGTGPLLVGCLPSVRTLVGTPWQPEYAGRVCVLEPPEAPYGVSDADVDLTHLRNAGLLSDLAALVIGRTDGWAPAEVSALHACVMDLVDDRDYPVLAGVECAHAAPLLGLPIGVQATVDGPDLIVDAGAVHDRVHPSP